MSPEPTGVHGLLKQRKLFTHKIDKNGNPMTVNTYWKRFNHVRREFIKRLYDCPNMETQMYAVFLESYKWSTHIGRGTYSNIVAQNANNIGEIAVMRGDSILIFRRYMILCRKMA